MSVHDERRQRALRLIEDVRGELDAAAVDADLIVHAPVIRGWLAELRGWQVDGAGSKRVLAMARDARERHDKLEGWRAEVRAREDARVRDEAARRARAGGRAVIVASGPMEGVRSSSVERPNLPPPDASVARRAFEGRELGPNAAQIRELAERFAVMSPAAWLAATRRDTPARREPLEQDLMALIARVPEARTWWDAIRAASAPIATEAAARYAAATGEKPREIEHIRSVNTWEGSREMVRVEPLPPHQETRFRDTLEYALAAVLVKQRPSRSPGST